MTSEPPDSPAVALAAAFARLPAVAQLPVGAPPSWWPLAWIALGLAALIGGWCFIRPAHPHLGRPLRALLWTLRVLAAAALLLLLPDWRLDSSRTEDEKPLLRVLVDPSASMAVADAGKGAQSRLQAALELLDEEIRPRWDAPERLRGSFASPDLPPLPADRAAARADQPRSPLGESLALALEADSGDRLGGVILLSDGAASDPVVLQQTAAQFRAARIPVHPWVLGSQAQAANLRLVSAALAQPSPAQPSLHLELALDSHGLDGRRARLEVRFQQTLLHQQEFELSGGSQTLGADFTSPYRGCQFYDLTLVPLPGEASAADNRLRLGAELRREPIRVLYMEGSVPTETSFLKDALEADPEIEVTSLHLPTEGMIPAQAAALRGRDERIFQDRSGRPVPSVCHPTRGYPASLAGLLRYDVVIDSDIFKEAFSATQLADTVAFVEDHGGGFVMVGGVTSFGAGGYEKTVIDKLMPVEIANRSDPLTVPLGIRPTETGWQHPILQVGATPAETRRAIEADFPGFSGANYARRPKPGAFVLLTAEAPGTGLDGAVLVSVQQIGRGRTMAFLSDTTTNWGERFEKSWGPGGTNQYYARFWNNAVRWLATDRIQRRSGQVRLELPSGRVFEGDRVPIRLAAGDAGQLAGLQLQWRGPDRQAHSLIPSWDPASHCWRAEFVARQVGDVQVEASFRGAEGTPVTTRGGIEVRPATDSDETIATAAQPGPMEELARLTGGRLLDSAALPEVLGQLAAETRPVEIRRSQPVWDRWWLLLPLLALPSIEWLIRRRREPLA